MSGTWSPTNKQILPGLYTRFEAAALASIQPGIRGVTAIAGACDWGPANTVVDVARPADITRQFGPDPGGDSLQARLTLALLGEPRVIKAYRILHSDAAASTLTLKDTAGGGGANVLKLDALYKGAGGNNLSVTTRQTPGQTATHRDLLLYWSGALLSTWTYAIADGIGDLVAQINADTSDAIPITATELNDGGNDTLAAVAGTPLAAGSNGSALDATDYAAFLAALELQEDVETFALNTSDAGILATVQAWVARVRAEGVLLLGVVGSTSAHTLATGVALAAAMDHEGIVVISNGGKLGDTTYTPNQTACFIAGAIAGQDLAEGLTNFSTPFSDTGARYTRSERETAVQSGCLVLLVDGASVRIEKGINSLVTLPTGTNRSWRKIRTIRIMDAWTRDIQRTAADAYIGKVVNNEAGRTALIGAIKAYLRVQVQGGLAENSAQFPLIVRLDPTYHGSNATITPEPDEVYPQIGARITDTMDYIFLTVRVL